MNFFYVFIGGGLGAMARYSISKLIPSSPNTFPTATWIANLISCIILGFLMSKFLNKDSNVASQLLLMTGFCGGFSTFSTFSAESYKLLQNGQHTMAFAYIFASILVCLIAIWLGIKLGNIT